MSQPDPADPVAEAAEAMPVSMSARLLRLLRHSAVYGLGSIASKAVAILLLPVYVRYLDPASYGAAEAVLVLDLFTVALVKLGLQNSMMRFYYDQLEHGRGELVVRTVMTAMLVSTTIGIALLVAFARPLAELFLDDPDKYRYVWIAAFGMWSSTIYSTLTATFRLQQRPTAFALTSLANISLSAVLTLVLVVGFHLEAVGLLLGNFFGTFLLIPVIGVLQRRFVLPTRGRGLVREMLAFGLPTMPMAIANQGLAMIDRVVLARSSGGLAALGVYALASRAAQVVMLVVIALQLSWQPFAYSIRDDGEARRTYAFVMTYFTATIGFLVAAAALLADPLVRLVTVPAYFDAARALPLLALAAGIYGMYFIAGIGASRVKKTRFHIVVAGGALAVSLAANLLLVPRYGFMGAAVAALLANGTLSLLMFIRSQHVFPVAWHWSRLARVAIVLTVIMFITYLLPAGELWTLPVRLAALALYPVALLLMGFLPPAERAAISRRLRRRASARQPVS